MKNLLIAILFISQVEASLWLTRADGAVSGVAFFIFSMIFIGLFMSVYDIITGLFKEKR